MARIVIADDDADIRELVVFKLRHGGHDVVPVGDGAAAVEACTAEKPDLVILDVMMPGMSGLDAARALRADSNMDGLPIIMLTARAQESDIEQGFEAGADDYIVKPFSPRELVARVRAVLRRWDGARAGTDVVRVRDLALDIPRMHASLGDRKLTLTPTEFQLLAVMARQPGRIFTRGQLLEAVHGVAVESYERAIDSHIKNIRRKIEPDPRHPRYVLAVHGIGYKFAEE